MYGINLILIFGMVITLNACVESKSSVEKYVAEVKKTAKSKISAIPPSIEIKSERYAAETLRSPFVLTGGNFAAPAMLTGPGGELIKQSERPDVNRPREFLEQFPLTSMLMVGTLSKPRLSWGLVKDPNGMIHAVKIGDYMGQNSGKIIGITPDQIRLNEIVPNGAGGWMETRTIMTLTVAVAPQPEAKADPKAKEQTPAAIQVKQAAPTKGQQQDRAIQQQRPGGGL